ncbi:MAG TPA: FecR domain-containing protein [Pyrinomonadaceae bacterium]|nr:FecR domain-containing protein [Pyrinomonadaceae bacterium]
MNLNCRKIITSIGLLVTLGIGQLNIGAGRAESNPSPRVSVSEATQAPLMGILSTRKNKAITVNGASANSGASIPSGATIETPDQVSATIKLGAMGQVCLAPNTKVVVEFDRQGTTGNVKLTLTQGCAILRTLKDTAGSITSPQGNIGVIAAATGGAIDVCLRPGLAPSVDEGSALDARAGASILDCGPAAAAAADGFPLSETIAIITGLGTIAIIPLLPNPSPSTP